MKKIAAVALALSLASTAAFAQTTPPAQGNQGGNGSASGVSAGAAPTVVVAGGLGIGGLVLGILGLLVLAGLGGGGNSSSTTTTTVSN